MGGTQQSDKKTTNIKTSKKTLKSILIKMIKATNTGGLKMAT